MVEKRQKNDLLRVEEAAAMLGVKASYIYRMSRERKLPHFKSSGGKLIYFRREDLEAWMMGTYVAPQNEVEVMAEKRAFTQNCE